MEYNNVKERIERLYSAVQIPISDGVSEYLAVDKDPHSNSAHFKTNQNALITKVLIKVNRGTLGEPYLSKMFEEHGKVRGVGGIIIG